MTIIVLWKFVPFRIQSWQVINKLSKNSFKVAGLCSLTGKPSTVKTCSTNRVNRFYGDFVQRQNTLTMKLDTPEFKNLFTPELEELASTFKRHDYEIRIVGGAVRDLLMGKQPEDIDFATVATPEQMKTMFTEEGIRMLNMKGEKHGTVTVRINNSTNFEVTTLRIDMVTDGRHAEVSFTTDWHLDAQRRDLTFNAMFLGLDGTVYDYFNGVEDLKNLRVAFVGDVAERIQEDYLRILRYFRFYGRIAKHPDSHDANTLEAISNNLNGLAQLSGERLMTELRKIMTGNFPLEIVLKMFELGIAPYLGFPGKPNIEEFKSVCNHSLPLKPNAVTLIVALLHNEVEILAFHNRMKMSNFERDMCLFINNHREDSETDMKILKVLLYSNSAKPSDVREWICELLKYKGETQVLNDFQNWEMPKFPISGLDIINKGIKKGPKVAHVLNTLKRIWAESDFQKTKEELLETVLNIEKDQLNT